MTPDPFDLSRIEEERVSEENVASLNSRKRSKVNLNQTNNISLITSKDVSFAKMKVNNTDSKKLQSSIPIDEVDILDEIKSTGSARKASTKIEILD